MREKQKFDRTAEYVCQRVVKIIGAARREGNFNSQLVGELKRWNEKLEVSHRILSHNLPYLLRSLSLKQYTAHAPLHPPIGMPSFSHRSKHANYCEIAPDRIKALL